jgi:hypothetical protein
MFRPCKRRVARFRVIVPDYAAFLMSVRSQQTSLFCRILAVKMAAGDRIAATMNGDTVLHDVI